MVLAGLWKLISRSFLIMVFAMLTPRFVLYPIFDYFYPSSSNPGTVYSSPLSSLEVIVLHRKELADLETELQGYLSPVGRQGISEMLNRAAAIEIDYCDYSKRMRGLRNFEENSKGTDQYQKLGRERQKLLENFDVNKFVRLYTVGERFSLISNDKALGVLQNNIAISGKHGVYLERNKKVSDEQPMEDNRDGAEMVVLNGEDICNKALDNLLNLLRDGQHLTDMITKIAEDIEGRYEKGESLEDLNVEAQVNHFNTESVRVKEEVETIIRRNRQALSRTREFIESATERVRVLADQFTSETNAQFQKYTNFYEELIQELKTENADAMHSSQPDMKLNYKSTEL